MWNELVFMTTNRAKLAHLKYLGSKRNVEIYGFRERTYYGSYSEPRIKNREALLRRSYESALHQWRRANQSLDSIFFLEDTSVKIEALSTSAETPGVDIKYWMRNMSFQKLNKLLEKNGGSRAVSVRSDIVAHIPAAVRKARAITEPFIWVTGVTHGTIVDVEEEFTGNLVHPWLDSKTFNKWFVPESCDQSISRLPIKMADAFDFRAAAFSNLLKEFEKLNVTFDRDIDPSAEQYSLPGFERNPPVLVFCGYSCAGKTTAADLLSKQYGFLHIEASDYMYRAFRERHGLHTTIKIGDFAEAALIEEPAIAAKPISEFIRRSHYTPIVVTGFRSPAEIAELRARLKGNTSVMVIFLHADFETRLKRAIARRRDDVDREKLARRDAQEERMGLSGIEAQCTDVHLPNKTRIGELSKRLKLIRSTKFGALNGNYASPSIRGFGPLESLILRSMLDTAPLNGGWTTSETAKLIGARFGIAKEKDNVSRYFTQEYRPYYEIEFSEGKSRYRLSTTGESVARILKADALSSR